MKLGVIGSSIWQQNLPLLERLTIPREDRESSLKSLHDSLGVGGLVYLATCNRVEFIYTAQADMNHADILHRLVDFFFRKGRNINFFPNDFYQYTGREAVSHLFRTVSSLDSLVVGETQITGQFKQALAECHNIGIVDELTERAAKAALTTASRVKTETNIGNGKLSMASLAAREIRNRLDSDKEAAIALIGTGEMTRKVAKYLGEEGYTNLLFVNRTFDRAKKLADEFGGRAIALADFFDSPPRVRGIVSATASTTPIFDQDFRRAYKQHGLSLLAVDLAVPRDFSDDFASDERVTYIDIPALKSRGDHNLKRKFVETGRAVEIVSEHVSKFISDRIEHSLKPVFRESHEESLRMARRAFTDLFRKKIPTIGAEEQEAVLSLMTKLIGHTAYQPARLLSEKLGQSDEQLTDSTLTALREEVVR